MTSIVFSELADALATRRLRPYRQTGDSDLDVVTRYVWNIKLCESFYTPLQNLEVALRNSLHEAISRQTGDALWLRHNPSWLETEQRDQISQAHSLLRRRHKPLEPGRIVAELTFGFWTGLLRTEYEQVLWPILIVSVFPHFPPHQRPRHVIAQRLTNVRHLRNRVSHHEPIWKMADLAVRHQQISEAMGWISPALLTINQSCDDFNHVASSAFQLSLKNTLKPHFP